MILARLNFKNWFYISAKTERPSGLTGRRGALPGGVIRRQDC